ncbi:MAG: hypothetical protein ACI9G1_000583 [Pirellulaceae bacterium]|jgi:hypothetical protein
MFAKSARFFAVVDSMIVAGVDHQLPAFAAAQLW